MKATQEFNFLTQDLEARGIRVATANNPGNPRNYRFYTGAEVVSYFAVSGRNTLHTASGLADATTFARGLLKGWDTFATRPFIGVRWSRSDFALALCKVNDPECHLEYGEEPSAEYLARLGITDADVDQLTGSCRYVLTDAATADGWDFIEAQAKHIARSAKPA